MTLPSRSRCAWRVPAVLLAAWAVMPVAPLAAQAPPRDDPAAPPSKVARAVRLAGAPPRLDGRLDDAAWAEARFFTDFIAKEPVENAPPSESTAVGILYDDKAIYIAARMYSRDPAAIQHNVARRDVGVAQSEHIWFSFDSYHDRRTAYSFGVTAAGVRMDWYHPRDNEYALDISFDPVWQARSRIDSLGWTAELRIPFSQLRFRREDLQQWGFNVDRWIPSKNEDIFWRPVPRNVTAWSSYMGLLDGLSGIKPSRRLELLPYVASNATFSSHADPANPFDPDGRDVALRAGGDLKMGLGPNLTAEATVNPDFGQVDADPAVVNLSAFEVIFDERRPFFVEGSQLLRGNGPNWFYSRRIGAPPPLTASGDYVDQPTATTIISAAKLTGRMSSGLSVGGLAAVTARSTASTYDSASRVYTPVEVAPVSGYGVMRLQQEFGRNRSLVGLTMTAVRRDLEPGPGLAQLVSRQAVTGGLDWNLRFGGGWYELSGWLGGSHVEGDTGAIAFQQRSSRRYYQRPDQSYVRYDPARTALSGFAAGLGLARISGRHWLWNVFYSSESPGLEQNDAGRISTADGHVGQASLTFRETQQGRLFRNYSVSLGAVAEWNYGLTRQLGEFSANYSLTFLNRWTLSGSAWLDVPSQDERLTRGGPTMGTQRTTAGVIQLANNFAATTQWRLRVYREVSDLGNDVYRLSGALTLRPGPRWFFSATPNYLYSRNPRQYFTTLADTLATATYQHRYIFATIDQSQWSVQFRFNYAFAPDVTLEAYVEPFIASGAYARHGELAAPGSRDLRVYGEAGGTTAKRDSTGAVLVTDGTAAFTLANQDFNVTSYRSNLVLRWEWRPGSTLYLVWQQNRGGSTVDGARVRLGDLFDGLRADGANFLALKISYWLSVN